MNEEAKPFEIRLEEACWTGPFPSLTFRAEEWRMAPPSPEEMAARLAAHDLERAMAELDREDAIMSAVRDVARGS